LTFQKFNPKAYAAKILIPSIVIVDKDVRLYLKYCNNLNLNITNNYSEIFCLTANNDVKFIEIHLNT